MLSKNKTPQINIVIHAMDQMMMYTAQIVTSNPQTLIIMSMKVYECHECVLYVSIACTRMSVIMYMC